MFCKSLIRFDSLINILLPRACLLCRRLTHEPHHLCAPCANELPILSHSCGKCAQFLHASERSQLICGQCLKQPPPYAKVFALFPYQPPLPRLVAGLKFEEQFSHGQFFSWMMIDAARHKWYADQRLPDLLLPMPLHRKRLQERGFNQALEIAKPVARKLKIPIDQGVIRSKATLPQSTLPASERRQNLAKAFCTERSYAGLHVAVIDDVMTTGHTVTAMAKLLIRHGARRVDIWCCARCDSRP